MNCVLMFCTRNYQRSDFYYIFNRPKLTIDIRHFVMENPVDGQSTRETPFPLLLTER